MKLTKNHKILSLTALLIIVFSIFSYDYSFFMYSHTVRQGESLWSILKYDVFQNQNIADHSLKYIKEQNPSFNQNYIQANTSRFSNDGDKIKIRSGKISIIAPNDTFRLSPTPILKKSSILNHNIQITYQNFLLVFFAGIIAFLIIKPQKIQNKKLLKKIPLIIFLSYILGSFIRLAMYLSLSMNFQSSVFIFQQNFSTIWVLTSLIIFFAYYFFKTKNKFAKILTLASFGFLALLIAVWIFLSNSTL